MSDVVKPAELIWYHSDDEADNACATNADTLLTAAKDDKLATLSVPKSRHFDDFYFSTDNGMAESRYVFLQHNQLPDRFKQTRFFRICETGFGTGLNFLLTCRDWLMTAPKVAQLHYLAIEKFPLTPADLQQAWSVFPELKQEAQALLLHYPDLLPGRHDLILFEGRVHLTLWWGDVRQVLPQVAQETKMDAWYLDGFAPAKNPEMWQPSLFAQMQRLSQSGTTFATFTSAGDVRRALAQAGFAVQKDVGYGKKREMCFGQFESQLGDVGEERLLKRQTTEKTPWFAPDVSRETLTDGNRQALVVGAGLAGATLAYALAQAGFQVTVLEAENQPASQASGNAAGAIHPLVTADWNLRSQFYLQGFETTLRWLKPWVEAGEVEGDFNGLMQLAVTETMRKRLQDAFARVGLPESFAQWCSPEQTTQKMGVETSYEGVFFPQGGWVRPASVVDRCLAHPNIVVKCAHKVIDFQRELSLNTWQVSVQTPNDIEQIRTAQLCFATGALAEDLHQRLHLPIRPVKGQVTQLNAGGEQSFKPVLQTAVTHKGYTVQTASDNIVTGATFEAPDLSLTCHPASDEENLKMLAEAMPVWGEKLSNDLERLASRVSFRPTTPDHLPILGAVPDFEWMREAYLNQKPSHMPHQYPMQRYQPGLYVSVGHGPRGLMSVFLAAEEVVRHIQGQVSWLPISLRNATHPARFEIRCWQKLNRGC